MRHARSEPTVRLHLWLETDQGVFFGLGRLQLLQDIQSGSSLKGAADRLGMSYRAAWGKIKATEEALGRSLLHRSRGRRGFSLTPEAEDIMQAFDQLFTEIEDYAHKRAEAVFPWRTEKYGSCEWDKSE